MYKKNYIYIFFFILLLLSIMIIYLLFIPKKITLDFESERNTYEAKISPLINLIIENNGVIDYRIKDDFWKNSFINIKLTQDLLDKSWVSYISNQLNKNEFIVNYILNIDRKAIFCNYIYSKDKFKKYIIGTEYKDSLLFDKYWWKFTTWKLYKITDDYWKYCIYKIF